MLSPESENISVPYFDLDGPGLATDLAPARLTVIPGSSCIPATHFGKDDSLQFSSLRGHIFTDSLVLIRKTTRLVPGCAASVRVRPRTRQEARGDAPAATCCIGGVVRNGRCRRLGCC